MQIDIGGPTPMLLAELLAHLLRATGHRVEVDFTCTPPTLTTHNTATHPSFKSVFVTSEAILVNGAFDLSVCAAPGEGTRLFATDLCVPAEFHVLPRGEVTGPQWVQFWGQGSLFAQARVFVSAHHLAACIGAAFFAALALSDEEALPVPSLLAALESFQPEWAYRCVLRTAEQTLWVSDAEARERELLQASLQTLTALPTTLVAAGGQAWERPYEDALNAALHAVPQAVPQAVR